MRLTWGDFKNKKRKYQTCVFLFSKSANYSKTSWKILPGAPFLYRQALQQDWKRHPKQGFYQVYQQIISKKFSESRIFVKGIIIYFRKLTGMVWLPWRAEIAACAASWLDSLTNAHPEISQIRKYKTPHLTFTGPIRSPEDGALLNGPVGSKDLPDILLHLLLAEHPHEELPVLSPRARFRFLCLHRNWPIHLKFYIKYLSIKFSTFFSSGT